MASARVAPEVDLPPPEVQPGVNRPPWYEITIFDDSGASQVVRLSKDAAGISGEAIDQGLAYKHQLCLPCTEPICNTISRPRSCSVCTQLGFSRLENVNGEELYFDDNNFFNPGNVTSFALVGKLPCEYAWRLSLSS
jgi:hypothetical protein